MPWCTTEKRVKADFNASVMKSTEVCSRFATKTARVTSSAEGWLSDVLD